MEKEKASSRKKGPAVGLSVQGVEFVHQVNRLQRDIRALKQEKTLYIGQILPIYAYGDRRSGYKEHSTSRIVSIFGFKDNKFLRIPRAKFSEYRIKEEYRNECRYGQDYVFNKHLTGSDSPALRMAMTLMDEGEPLETLQSLYDSIHNAYEFSGHYDWECVIAFDPSLKARFERKKPDRKKISEILFGEYVEEYERLVQSVRIKSIDRIPENHNKNTFDYIQVEVRLSAILPMKTKKILCKKYIRTIGKHILIVVEESPRFQKFSVSTNILKVEKATIGIDSTLYVTLGIKESQRTRNTEGN